MWQRCDNVGVFAGRTFWKNIVPKSRRQVLQLSIRNLQKESKNWIKTSCRVTIQSSGYQCLLHQNSLSYSLLHNGIALMKFVPKCSSHYEAFILCVHAITISINIFSASIHTCTMNISLLTAPCIIARVVAGRHSGSKQRVYAAAVGVRTCTLLVIRVVRDGPTYLQSIRASKCVSFLAITPYIPF